MKVGATVLALLVVLSDCATSPEQRALLAVAPLPELAKVPFFAQDDYQPPAGFAATWNGTLDDLAADDLAAADESRCAT